MSVCLSVCLSVRNTYIVHDSDRGFYPIFLKFGMWVTHVMAKTKFDAQ